MRIALISDIHSNFIALNSVLKDIKKQRIEKIFCLGDLIGYAPYPDKVFPMLKEPKNNIKTIMGNYDEAVALGKEECGCGYTSLASTTMGKISFEWTLKHISQENKEWMKNLPRNIRLKIKGKRILMVHGSPENISGRVDLLSDDETSKMIEKANVDILFCGHTHIPFHKIIDGKHIINPGSVGRPRIGSAQASYAVVALGKGLNVRFRFIDYDHESFAKEIEHSNMPKNNFAEIIRTGYWSF